MKYIITESKFDSLVRNYIDDVLSGFEVKTNEFSHSIVDDVIINNGVVIGEIMSRKDGKKFVIMDSKFFYTTLELFGLSIDDAKQFFLEWMNKNLDGEFVNINTYPLNT